MPASVSSTSPPTSPPKTVDPVLQNAIRYTVSSQEYKTLHEYLIKRAPKAVRRSVPPPARYDAAVQSKDDYNAAAVRASLRVFLAAQTGLKLWDIVTAQVWRRRAARPPKVSTLQSSNFRLSISAALILLLHRLLYRFFTRLRANLLTKDAAPFRRRNPRISRALTARLAPAIGASLAGFALGAYPGDQFRLTVTIYVATKAAEFLYNALEDEGWFQHKPWWFGSWMLMPPVYGQLLYAFLFDRDCFPKAYGEFNLKYTPNYVQRRPVNYPAHLPWPGNDGIVEGLAEISRLNYPAFISPILFPKSTTTLPSSLAHLAPITSSAHPSIKSLSCALLHPHEPSCLRTYLLFYLQALPQFGRFFLLVFSLFALPSYKQFLKSPFQQMSKLSIRTARMTLFAASAIGTSWGSICLFQHLLPRTLMPRQRWFWGGFLGGLPAFLERKHGRSTFLYSLRASIDSLWKVGVKRRWWRSSKSGDVWVFVASFMVLNAIYEINTDAVTDGILTRALAGLRGEAFTGSVGHEKAARRDED